MSIGIILSFFLYFYSQITNTGEINTLIGELDNQQPLQDFFAAGDEALLQANFTENIENKISENKKYEVLKNKVFLCKTHGDYISIGLKLKSTIEKYIFEQFFNRVFFRDSLLGDFMVLETYPKYKPLTETTYKHFGSKKNYTDDAVTKEMAMRIKETQSRFNISSYYFYNQILWVQLRFDKETNAYNYKFDRDEHSLGFKHSGEQLFNHDFDSIQVKYYDELKQSLLPTLEKNEVSMVVFKSVVPYFSPITPPNYP